MLEDLLKWELVFIATLQSLGDWPILLMNLFTFIGDREFYLLIMPALYWCGNSRLGLRVGLAFLLSTSLAILLKMAIHAPRPYWFDPQIRLLTTAEPSFGAPSAHAQNAVITWGLIATYWPGRFIWPAALALMIFVGFSRVWLGVHYLTDVVSGWLLGTILLFLFLRLEEPAILWFGRRKISSQLALVFGVSLVLILLGVFIRNNLTLTWQLPPEWIENAARYVPDEPLNPFFLDDLVSSAAAFFGLAAGAIFFGPFETTGPWPKQAGRYVLGVIGILILWRGLGIAFDLLAPGETLLAHILRYIRYSLVGLWISALAPWLFVRLGLISRRSKRLEAVPNLR